MIAVPWDTGLGRPLTNICNLRHLSERPLIGHSEQTSPNLTANSNSSLSLLGDFPKVWATCHILCLNYTFWGMKCITVRAQNALLVASVSVLMPWKLYWPRKIKTVMEQLPQNKKTKFMYSVISFLFLLHGTIVQSLHCQEFNRAGYCEFF